MFSQQRLLSRIRASDLCQRDTLMSTAWQTIGWWETRRVAFNLIVGSAGTISSVLVGVVGLGSHFLLDSDCGVPDPPLVAVFAVVIYAIMARSALTAPTARIPAVAGRSVLRKVCMNPRFYLTSGRALTAFGRRRSRRETRNQRCHVPWRGNQPASAGLFRGMRSARSGWSRGCGSVSA
jgi:hypothetical protein